MKEYVSLKTHVYEHIRELINSGKLTEENRITEQIMADELGVSRTPVREALLQLAGDGLLENSPRKGFTIKKLHAKDIIEIYEVIGFLDGKTAVLAIDTLKEEDYQELQFLIDSMDSAIINNMFQKYNQLQEEFHNYYGNKCGNQKLISTLKKLKKTLMNTSYSNVPSDKIISVLTETNREHQVILDYLINKKKIAVQRYIEDIHWREANAAYDSW